MRSLTAEKLKVTSAVQNKASKAVLRVVPIPEKSDVSAAVWEGLSHVYLLWDAAPVDVAGLFESVLQCGNIVILSISVLGRVITIAVTFFSVLCSWSRKLVLHFMYLSNTGFSVVTSQ